MSAKFKQVFSGTHSALSQNPSISRATFAAENQGREGLHRRVAIPDFSVDVDEPESLGGTDGAPNPVEYALAALATCREITYRLHAAALGIPLRDVSVKLKGDLDLRGFFDVEKRIRPGFTEIRGSVTFDSDAAVDDLRQLKQVVDAHCPVLDLFQNATPMYIQAAIRTASPRTLAA